MKNAIKIFFFTVLVTAFYNYVGQMVPQKETYPPKTIELSDDLTTEEMVDVGLQIAAGKGTCLTCHTIGSTASGRYPDLANIGSIAATRKEGMSAVEYLAESLYEPNTYIVEGFLPGMPVVNKAPINLTDQEILAVIAWLQSLGGTPSVTMQTELRWQSDEQPAQQVAASADPLEQAGQELFTTYYCFTCHHIDSPDRLLGPSLIDVGARLSRDEIREAIMEPDATITPGFEDMKGQMKAQLEVFGFYRNVTEEQLQTLVDYLATKKGKQ